jgi:hypothetical protein
MNQVRAHILDALGKADLTVCDDPNTLFNTIMEPRGHYRVETWTIGTDVTAEQAQQWRDPATGDIYIVVAYKDGKPSKRAISKILWEQGKAEMDRIGGGDAQEGPGKGGLPSGSPSIEFYAIPIGLGIAYGLFARGFFLHWSIEAAALSVVWAIGTCVFRRWKYQAYMANCARIGQSPRARLFIALQAVSTAAVVFAIAGIIMGIRWAFFR